MVDLGSVVKLRFEAFLTLDIWLKFVRCKLTIIMHIYLRTQSSISAAYSRFLVKIKKKIYSKVHALVQLLSSAGKLWGTGTFS